MCHYQLLPFPLLILILCLPAALAAGDTPGEPLPLPAAEYGGTARFHPVAAENGMVVTQDAYATRAAREVLEEGGNAIDAAVTAGFVLCATLPRGAGIGGGGFMVVHLAEGQRTVTIDYRESAPRAAHRDLFLDKHGDADPERSLSSALGSGVPGTVRGFARALEEFGTISLARALEPAIQLAEDGFPVSPDLSWTLWEFRDDLLGSPAARAVFFADPEAPPRPGAILRQPDLAETLRRISVHGPDEFYSGETARLLIADIEATGGIMTAEDLANYSVIERETVRGTYRGYEIHSMPPPSSGGVHLVQMLNVLEGYPLAGYGHNSAKSIRIMAETMKRAYADRAVYLGDPAFVEVPIDGLLSAEYAASIRAEIERQPVTPSNEIQEGDPKRYADGGETTHFSVIDRWGNAVANTFSLNTNYGRRHIAPGTGVLWNNTLDDFAAKPGVPNVYGLIGADANAVEGGKRPLSSMTPTLVLRDGEVVLATGSPGGARIITTTLQVILNSIDHGMNIQEAVNASRIHHQWLPDTLELEDGISPDTRRLLVEMGYRVESPDPIGAAQSIQRGSRHVFGAPDPRRQGALAEGH